MPLAILVHWRPGAVSDDIMTSTSNCDFILSQSRPSFPPTPPSHIGKYSHQMGDYVRRLVSGNKARHKDNELDVELGWFRR